MTLQQAPGSPKALVVICWMIWLNSGGGAHRVDNELILSQLERTVAPATNFGDGSSVENIWDEQFDLVIVGQQDVDTAIETIVESVETELL